MAKIGDQPKGRSKRVDSDRDFKPFGVDPLAATNQINIAKESRPGLERLQATAQYAGEVLQVIDDERIKNKNADDIAEINVKTTEFSRQLLKRRAALTAEQFNAEREKFEAELLKEYENKYKDDPNGYEKFQFKSKVQNALTKQKLDLMSTYMDSVVKDSLIRIDKQEEGIDLLISEGMKNMNPDMVPVFADNIEKMLLAIEKQKFKLGGSAARDPNIQGKIADKKMQIYINSLVNRLPFKDEFYGVDANGNPTEKDLSQLQKEYKNDQHGKKQGWKWTDAQKTSLDKKIGKLISDQKDQHNRAELAHNNDFSTITIDKALKIIDPIVTKHIDPRFRSTIKDRQRKAIQELRDSIGISSFKGPNAKKRLNELIEVIDAIAKGKDASAPVNYQVFSNIKTAILNQTLTSLGEPMTVLGGKTPMQMIGNGLSFDEYQELNTLINTPSVLRQAQLIRDETNTIVDAIWRSTGAIDLSGSALRKIKIQREVERLIRLGREEGKTIKNMTNPNHPDYVDKDFVISNDERFRGSIDDIYKDIEARYGRDIFGSTKKIEVRHIVKNNRRLRDNPITGEKEYSYITIASRVNQTDEFEPLSEILNFIQMNPPTDGVYKFLVNTYGKEVAEDILNKPLSEALFKGKEEYGQDVQDYYKGKD